jgi:Domain of unknown function (DUF397)
MTTPQNPELTRPWRKSSHSDTGGQCVEVAQAGTTCAVRDSTNPDGSRLGFSQQAWAAFTSGIKHGPCRVSASGFPGCQPGNPDLSL